MVNWVGWPPRFDAALQVVPAGHLVAVDGDDAITMLEAGRVGRGPRDDGVHRGARPVGDTLADDHDEEEHERDEQIDGDARQHDLQAIGIAPLPVGARLVGRVDLFEVAHADDAHVPTERQRLDAVLGLAAPERPEARAETEEELGDLHPGALCHDVVARFVQHHHEHDPDHDRERDAAPRNEDRQRGQCDEERDEEPGGAPPAHVDGGLFERILHRAVPALG